MEEFIKYKKIRNLGDEENEDIFKDKEDLIYIQEKVDGGNFRFYITKEGVIVFGSRTQQLTSDEGEDDNVQKNFMRCINQVRERLKDRILTDYYGLIFYGESMTKHTMGYDWENIPPFLGFDILDTETEKFLEVDDMYIIYRDLGLDTVPLIKIVKAEEIKDITDKDVPKSKFCESQAEGIVFKNCEKQIYAKYVRAAFKEKNKEEFGGSKKQADTDEDYFTAVYCTNARVEKIVFKLLDDGKKLHLSMMPDLIKAVYKDIWEEHWNEITSTKGRTINFDKLKRSFTRRCFAVLKNIITNNAIQAGDTDGS